MENEELLPPTAERVSAVKDTAKFIEALEIEDNPPEEPTALLSGSL